MTKLFQNPRYVARFSAAIVLASCVVLPGATALGQRNPGRRGAAEGGGDPRHDLDRDTVAAQSVELLAAAAED